MMKLRPIKMIFGDLANEMVLSISLFCFIYFVTEDLIVKLQKISVLVGLFVGLTNVSFAAGYSPDQLAQFKSSKQCYNCDLSGATISGNFSSAILYGTNLTGANCSGREANFALTNFSGSNLSSSNWSHANLSGAQLDFVPLVKANFSDAELSYADFQEAITTGAIFDNANLLGSNITQGQLDSAASYCGAILPNGTRKNC
jgi:hypothetical protein